MARLELKPSGVIFKEDTHQYFRESDGKELSGITGLIQRQLFPTEFDSVPKHILEQAASYGTDIHKSCELFDTMWEHDGTQELQDYIELCKENGLVHEKSEFTITDNENYASQIDKVYRASDNTFHIGDIKTYYGKMKGEKLEKCRWQLSIYAYLFELQNPKAKVDKLFVIHLRNKQKSDGTYDHIKELVYVNRIPSDICKDLLDADLRGEQFKNPFAVPVEIQSKALRIRELIATKNNVEEELNSLKADILTSMEFLDVTTWQSENVKLTRKLPTTRTTFDLKSFKAAHTEINDYDNYMKTSNISSSLMVNVA